MCYISPKILIGLKHDWSLFLISILKKIILCRSNKANIYKYNLILARNCLCWHFFFYYFCEFYIQINHSFVCPQIVYRTVYSEFFFFSYCLFWYRLLGHVFSISHIGEKKIVWISRKLIFIQILYTSSL